MRILHISSAQTFGGGERHLADLVNGLAARGHEVFVGLRPKSPLPTHLEIPDASIFTFPLRNALDARSASALAKLVGKKQIEIVHAHMARDYPLAAYAVRQNPAARLVVTRHVLFPLSRLHKITLAGVSRMIAVSNAAARAIHEQALIPAEKVVVVPNGVDWQRLENAKREFDRAEFCRRWEIPESSLLVGTVGTLTPLKGQEDFLQAAAQLKDKVPGAFFVVSGIESSPAQKYRKQLERLTEELGLNDRVRFIGWMDDVTSLFCALDVFVSASQSESFGLAIVEAMAAGAAVVATTTEGAQEIIRHKTSGLLVPVGGIEEMADAITTLLSSNEERARLVASARADVRERFSVERMVEETEGLYLAVRGS